MHVCVYPALPRARETGSLQAHPLNECFTIWGVIDVIHLTCRLPFAVDQGFIQVTQCSIREP